MSKKDVMNYYYEQQEAYLEMVNDIKDIDKDYNNGLISREQYENIIAQVSSEIELVKSNFDRVSYIIYLLNKNKKNKEQIELKMKELPEDCSLEALNKENKEAIEKINKVKGENK